MVRFRIKPVDISDDDDSSGHEGIFSRMGFNKSEKALLLEFSPIEKEKVSQRYKDTSAVIFEDCISGKWTADDPFHFRDLKSSSQIHVVEPKGHSTRKKRLLETSDLQPDKNIVAKQKNTSESYSLPNSLDEDIENHTHQLVKSPKVFLLHPSGTPVQPFEEYHTVLSETGNTTKPPAKKRRCIVS